MAHPKPGPYFLGPQLPICAAPVRTFSGGGIKEKRIGDRCCSTSLVEMVDGVPLCWVHRKAVLAGFMQLPAPAPVPMLELEGNERWRQLGKGRRE